MSARTSRTSCSSCMQAADFDVEQRSARHHLYRRDRQDHPQERESLHHPRRLRRGRAAGAAEDPGGHDQRMSRRRAAASTRSRSSSRSTRRTSSSSAAVRSTVWTSIILRRTDKSCTGLRQCAEGSRAPSEARKGPDHAEGANRTTCVKFGLIPELIGRLPVITALDDLDEDALVRVLKEPSNSLGQAV